MDAQPTKFVQDDGTEYWSLNGQPHRTDGPAVTWPDGAEYWYLNGQRHRTDGPAATSPHGTREWFVSGQMILDGTGTLNTLHTTGRIDELRLILEAWTPDGPTIAELHQALTATQ